MLRHIFVKHWPLIALTAVVILFFWILYLLRSLLLPFILGFILAYLLKPVVSWLERRLPRPERYLQAKRVTLLASFYLVVLGVVGTAAFYGFTMAVQSTATVVHNAYDYISSAIAALQQWTDSFRQVWPPEIRDQIDQIVQQAGTAISNAFHSVLSQGISAVPSTMSLVFGFLMMPLFLFYLLKDWEKLGTGFFRFIPSWADKHTRSVLAIIEDVFGRFMRAQLVLGLVVGILTLIGLLVLGVPFAVPLAVIAAVAELVPTIGPWISGAIAVIVTLGTAPEKALWVLGLFVVVQLLENNLLVPRIQGGYLRIHPAVALLLLVLGAKFAGFWGLILILPLTATLAQLYKYVDESACHADGGGTCWQEDGETTRWQEQKAE
ncbi:MAG: AI-2E family transporter [Chloroflexi bacterium]|nr:AI-2E family transporter [Chloroflexota bacterium]